MLDVVVELVQLDVDDEVRMKQPVDDELVLVLPLIVLDDDVEVEEVEVYAVHVDEVFVLKCLSMHWLADEMLEKCWMLGCLCSKTRCKLKRSR